MLARGEAANTYRSLIKTLMERTCYFHTVDGKDLKKSEFDYDTFIKMIPQIEYLDTEDQSYTKFYINPLMKILLILSSKKVDSGTIEFHEVPFEILEIIYDQLSKSVSHGYRLALDDARKNMSNLFKEDRSLSDIT